jgi:hypothetical protein
MRIFPTKRRLKRIAIGLVILLAIALIANGIMAWRTGSRWRGRIAAIRAGGDPASIADLAPTPVPDDQNAAAVIAKLGPRLEEFGKDNWNFTDKDPLGIDYEKRGDRGEPATEEQIVAIRKILDKYPDIDAGVAAAAACDKYASLANYSLDHVKLLEEFLVQMQRFRTAARFLDWRMEVLVAERQQDKAVNLGIEMLRLAREYDHEPASVNMLVATAVRGIAVTSLYDALAAGRVSPEVHAALDRELALDDDRQRMVRTLKSERAYAIDAMLAMPNVGPQAPAWLVGMFGWTTKILFAGSLDYLDDEIASAAQRARGGPQGVERHQIPDSSGHGVMAELMIPGMQTAFDADARGTAMVRALRIFNALRLFAEKNGREAKRLDELGLPNEATIDPFDGKPLKIKHTNEGWVVYTVMLNGVDDGGDFIELKDYGVAPRELRLTKKPGSSENDNEPKADQ